MSVVLRSLIRDPSFARSMTRPISRAIRRWDDDAWHEVLAPAKRTRRYTPVYESPLSLMEDMSRQMVAAMNRMQEFAEDLESLDALVSRPVQRKKREEMTIKRTESGGLQLALDVTDFKPEDLNIKLVDNNLIVEACSETSGKDSYQKAHFKRWFKLPEDCKLEEIRSKLTEDNRLVIDLPSNKPLEQKARSIPIETTKPSEAKQVGSQPELGNHDSQQGQAEKRSQ